MDSKSLAKIAQAQPQPNPVVRGALTDVHLSLLARTSPAAAYVRSLATDAGRSSMMQAISVAADHLAPGSIPASRGKGRGGNGAERFMRACGLPWHAVRPDRLSELRASLLRTGAAASTVNKVLAAVKGVLQQCWQSGSLDGDFLERCRASLKGVRGSTLPKGRHLPKADIAALFHFISRTKNPAAARDAALLALLCIGLRRAEVAGLKMSDYDRQSGRLAVYGKGNKQRAVFLTNGAQCAVEDWLSVRADADCDSLLLRVNKGDNIVPAGISSQSIYATLLKRAGQAGLKLSPHDLRRTFIGEALSAGIDVVTIQRLMGHSSPATTSRYDRRNEDVARTAMASVAVPYLRSAS